MAREEDLNFRVVLNLSPALHATINRVAVRAGKSFESTVKSLLWIACGHLQLGPWKKGYAK